MAFTECVLLKAIFNVIPGTRKFKGLVGTATGSKMLRVKTIKCPALSSTQLI